MPHGVYGTIGSVSDHRVRLTDEDLDLICACLAARLAMAGPARARAIRKLGLRLADTAPGNPAWRFGDEYPLYMQEGPK
jgi:hypothetical protein